MREIVLDREVAKLLMERIWDYNGYIKKRLFIKMRHNITHEQMVSMQVCDFYATVCVELDGMGTAFVVQNSMLEKWGVGKDRLFADAIENMSEQYPMESFEVSELVGSECKSGYPLTCFTNIDGMNGAAVLLYPGFLPKAYEAAGGDFYIIPSSVHEVLVISREAVSADALSKIVREVNMAIVSDDEKLSDNAFMVKQSYEIAK